MFVSPLFGVVAPELGWVPPPRFLLRRDRILRLLSNVPLGRLVEVGCGGGSLLHELALRCDEAVGIETSGSARALAKAIAREGDGRQRIMEAPLDWYQDRDMVCAFDVLEHIEHDQRAIAEWSDWLRPGGWLCISVPAHATRWGAGDEWAGHWRRYDRQDIEALVASQDLSLEHVECYGFPLGNITEWYGERFYRKALRDRVDAVSKAEATGESGVDRDYFLKRFGWLNSLPGRASLRLAIALQSLTSRTDWGTGYLILARKA